ncbi:hypothetical protein STEG23_027406 [Scotinomys teguina]
MTSEEHMPGPMCLIENVKGQLTTNQEALKILSAIEQPVVVVAIVGLYRTGKSYLMNKLAGKKAGECQQHSCAGSPVSTHIVCFLHESVKNVIVQSQLDVGTVFIVVALSGFVFRQGFSLGSTVQSHTKGIWMWCVPHPQKPGHTLVLLDTEGLGDVEKGDDQNDCWIFALAVLLSSTFVYNSMGTINQQAMNQLHWLLSYVTELTDRIRTRSSPDQDEGEDSVEFVSFFPDFVWTLRDFSLELSVNGEPISPDEYLENSLKLIHILVDSGEKDKEGKFNLPRLCIRKFFPKKKCFVFERPAHRKKLGQLESLQDQDLDSDFVEQVAEFCSYVFSCSKVKTLSGGIKVNGPLLKNLVITYVNTISNGDLPCIENAVLALSQTENAAAVQKAITHYDLQMSQKLQLPTETLQELLDLHRTMQCVKAEAAQATARLLEERQQKNDQLMKEKEKSYQEYVKELTEKMGKEQAQMREEHQRVIEHKLKVCEELCWNIDGDCIESVDCFWLEFFF